MILTLFGGTNPERDIGEKVLDVKHLEENLTQVSSQTVYSQIPWVPEGILSFLISDMSDSSRSRLSAELSQTVSTVYLISS